MKYVALLRGINVGGNSMIKMAELKQAFEKLGYTNVLTYINSGNVIFESDEKNTEKIVKTLEKSLSKTFHIDLRLVVRSHEQIKEIIEQVPDSWKKTNDLRCYVAFLKDPLTPDEALKEIPVKEGVDSAKSGKHVIYMSTKMSGLTKSGFTKIIGTKIYKEMTWRNFNTTQKILALIEKE